MKTSKFLLALSVNCMVGLVLATATDWNPIACMAGVNIAGAAMFQVKQAFGVTLFDGLAVEVWLPDVMEGFYPTASFLNGARDMSALVNNDKINLAEAGADPTVMKNNTNYPIGANVATDTPLEVALDFYDTDSTIVRNAIAVELAYDQRSLYTKKHQKALRARFARDAAFAYAPAGANATNQIISMGAGDSVIDGIIDLRLGYKKLVEDEEADLHLVLCPEHEAAIQKENKTLYKDLMANPGTKYMGFSIWSFGRNPIYVTATSQKAAFGTAYSAGTHKNSSFAFMGGEVMKAQGTFKMFSTLNDPAQKGDVFNFQMRGLVSSLRGKYAAAILK